MALMMKQPTTARYLCNGIACIILFTTVTEQDISKKLRYLRNQYTDEIRKTKSCKSGMSADNRYVTKWKYFQFLSFLINHVNLTPANRTSNLQIQVSLFIFCNKMPPTDM